MSGKTHSEHATVRETTTEHDQGWKVTLFDCHCHFVDEVIFLLMKALGCSRVVAGQYTELTQQFGQAVVFRGSEAECNRVADQIGSTGLRVEVDKV